MSGESEKAPLISPEKKKTGSLIRTPSAPSEANSESPDKDPVPKVAGPSYMFVTQGDVYGMAPLNGHLDTLHCHQQRDEGIDKKARNKLILSSCLVLAFMMAQIIGGVLSNSLAIATDAAHLLADFASFMVSLLAISLSKRPRSPRFSFGWHRAEVLGATTSVLLIWLVTGILAYSAAIRMMNLDFEVDTKVMLITSSLGVANNIILGFVLHQKNGGHGHSHNAGLTPCRTRQPEANQEAQDVVQEDKPSISVGAAFYHVIGDFFQSLAVLIAACVMYIKPSWVIVDPICTLVFSLVVLAVTIGILHQTVLVFLEATPDNIDYEEVKKTFEGVEGIMTVHNLRLWVLSPNKLALSAHLTVSRGGSQEVLKLATVTIRSRFDFYEMNLQVEEHQVEMNDCGQCQDV